MKGMIEVNGLTKSYGGIKALDNVSFNVGKGELFGIIGPDGAGKSTLYNILATLLAPDSGTAEMAGCNVMKDYRKLRTLIGYMPERFSLYPDLTVAENLNFFASLFGASAKRNYELIAPVFGQLEKFPNRKAGKLSGGMKQKLALSCALIHRPEVLLLDEPTTGVDVVSREEFWQMLGHIRNQGITILVSTSYMDEAHRCDRISLINEGHILDTDSPEALLKRINERIYNAVAPNMFRLLSYARGLGGVINCYTFGATLHLVVDESFDPRGAAEGFPGSRFYPAKAKLEDLFIKILSSKKEEGR